MALTQDCHLVRYGVPDGHQLVAAPVKAAAQLYHGAVGLLRSGFLINAASPASTDIIVGMVQQTTGSSPPETGPGILGGTNDGDIWVDCATGTFGFQSGTGSDAITEANAGQLVYYQGENSAGPIAAATSGGGTRPQLGYVVPIDPTMPLQQAQVFVKLLNLAGGV